MKNKRRLLLISNSTNYGNGYLDHCRDNIVSFLGKSVNTVLFFPYANPDMDKYAKEAKECFEKMGYNLVSIHRSNNPVREIEKAEAFFVGGGNTFLLLKNLYDNNLIDSIKNRAKEGIPYMGTSAGSNVAGISIGTTNDMPVVYPSSFNALGLIPFNINPHYFDSDPKSKHEGENRIERIEEFHKLNDITVLGLREGAMILVKGDTILLKGAGAKIFIKGEEFCDKSAGSVLDYLL